MFGNQTVIQDLQRHRGKRKTGNGKDAVDDDGVESLSVSFIFEKDRLGIAFYDEKSSVLSINEVSETVEVPSLLQVLEQYRPGRIYCSTKTHPDIVQLVRECSDEMKRSRWDTDQGEGEAEDDEATSDCTLRILKSTEYAYDTARARIRLIRLPGMAAQTSNIESDMILQSYMNFSSTLMVRALGGMLSVLQQRIRTSADQSSKDNLDDAEMDVSGAEAGLDHVMSGQVRVTRIETIPLDRIMNIDADTFHSLSIFRKEPHPAYLKRFREGFSLFGIMNQTKSGVGSRQLRQWMLRPTVDKAAIERRLDAVTFLLDEVPGDYLREFGKCLFQIRDIDRIIHRIEKVQASVNDWWNMFNTLVQGHRVGDLLVGVVEGTDHGLPEELEGFTSLFPTNLLNFMGMIQAVVDFDDSRELNRICIQQGIDDTLDEMKRTYDSMDAILSRVRVDEVNNLSQALQGSNQEFPIQELRVVYFPQLGFLCAYPRQAIDALPPTSELAKGLENSTQLERSNQESTAVTESTPGPVSTGDITSTTTPHPSSSNFLCNSLGWQFQFATEAFVYFKNGRMQQLDSEIGDIHSNIIDREQSIVRDLEQHVADIAHTIARVSTMCSKLDALRAMALSAREYGWCRPYISDEIELLVQDSRHPLQEQCVDMYVPNDIELRTTEEADTTIEDIPPEKNRVVLLTGPNSSGKSVFLKQVGLICYMAHIGSYVPARNACVGVCDAILTRIHTRESTSALLSTFCMDVQQMGRMTRVATPRSLLLIDEFGKGTQSADGLALLFSYLEYFLNMKHNCPRMLCVTHFIELFEYRFFRQKRFRDRVQHYGMDFSFVNESSDDIAFLYKLIREPLRRRQEGDHHGVVAAVETGRSFANCCARRAGVPETVLTRANVVSDCLISQTSLEPVSRNAHLSQKDLVENVLKIFADFDVEDGDVEAFMSELGRLYAAQG